MSTRTVVTVAAALLGAALVVAGGLAVLSDDRPAAPGGGGASDGPRPAALADRGAGAAPVVRQDPDAAPAPPDGAPWVLVDGFDAALSAIDWREVGSAYAELLPLLRAHARAVTRDRSLSVSDAARLGELREALDRLAAPLAEKVPSFADHGVLVHPAFLANSVPAALHALGRGLTEEQLESLAAAARRHAATTLPAEEMRADPMLTSVQRVAIEAEARRGVCDDIDDLLTERQRSALHPEPLTGRVGLDPFAAVEVFRDRVLVVDARDEQAAAEEVVGWIAERVGGAPERRDEASAAALEMLRPLVNAFFPDPPRTLDRAGHVKLETCLVPAQSMAAVTEQIVALVVADPRQAPPDVVDRPIILVRAVSD